MREVGVRVPCIVRWPNKITAGSESHHISDFADMFPSFAELLGAQPPVGLDGVSILPTFLGKFELQKTRDYHYWEAAPAQALRQGNGKIYRGAPNQPVELFNFRTDIGETTNVASEHAEVVARLTARTTEFLTEKAVAFIEANRDQPFLLQVSHAAVHIPLSTTPELSAKKSSQIAHVRRRQQSRLRCISRRIGFERWSDRHVEQTPSR